MTADRLVTAGRLDGDDPAPGTDGLKECRREREFFAGLKLDLVRQAPPSPWVVMDPRAATALDELAGANDDLFLALFAQFRIEHEQDFVLLDHGPRWSPSGLSRPRRPATFRDNVAMTRQEVAAV